MVIYVSKLRYPAMFSLQKSLFFKNLPDFEIKYFLKMLDFGSEAACNLQRNQSIKSSNKSRGVKKKKVQHLPP